MPASHAGGRGFKSPPVHHLKVLDSLIELAIQSGVHTGVHAGEGQAKGIGPKYSILFEDQDVRNWYDNLAQGSKLTAKKSLRRLGFICASNRMSPGEMAGLAGKDDRWSYNFLIGLVRKMSDSGFAGSYIEDNKKVVISWLRHHGLEVRGKIKIKGSESTPTLKDKGGISQTQLRSLFACSPPRVRLIESLLGQSGLRPETIGDEEGSDGLRLSDLPELQIGLQDGAMKASFLKTPPMLTVRPELSKARHQYFTFLSDEGCEFLAEYLSLRWRSGEKLDGKSPLITPGRTGRKNEFVRTTLLGRLVKERMEKCGINARPYDLRAMFDTQLLIAESHGLTLRDYRVFFMGHRGDIEHRYTLNRQKLPEDLVNDLRKKYREAHRYLASSSNLSSRRSVEEEVRAQMLLVAGFTDDEIGKEKLLELSSDEITRRIRGKVYSNATGDQLRQRMVSLEELDDYLGRGWTCVQVLETMAKAIVNPPKF